MTNSVHSPVTLKEARIVIDQIDTEMARLFEQRMEAAQVVAQNKMQTGDPIYVPEREKAILERAGERLTRTDLIRYYTDFQTHVMRISRAFQADYMERQKNNAQDAPEGKDSH